MCAWTTTTTMNTPPPGQGKGGNNKGGRGSRHDTSWDPTRYVFFLFSDFLSKILWYLVLPRWWQTSTPPQWCIKLAAGAVGAQDADASQVPSKFIFFFFFGSTNFFFFFPFRLHACELHHSHHFNVSNDPSNSHHHHSRRSSRGLRCIYISSS